MKIINLAAKSSVDEAPSSLSNAIGKARLAVGGADVKAQEAVIERMGRILDNRFTLLRHWPGFPADALPGVVLVGPGGVWVLHISPVRGVFRAEGPRWEGDNGRGEYKPARPNLIEAAQRLQTAAADALAGLEDAPAPEAAVLLVQAGAHVDSRRPAVRVVPADGIDRFFAAQLKVQPPLGGDMLSRILERLQNPSGEEPTISEVAFAHLDGRLPEQPARPPSRLEQVGSQPPAVIRRIDRRTNFTPRQWIIVGVLLAVNIIVVVIIILVSLVGG